MKPTPGTLEAALTDLRKHAKTCNPSQIAREARLSKSIVHNFIHAQGRPTVQNFDKMAQTLGFRFKLEPNHGQRRRVRPRAQNSTAVSETK